MRPLCVLGLGLIGGSVLRAAASAGIDCWGATASEADAAAARAEGFTVLGTAEALRAAAEREALVCLAVPLPALEDVLPAVHEHAPGVRLTDVVSVKAPVYALVRRLAPRTRFVGGHPMTGTAESGWSAGSGTLLRGARWVVCLEEDTDLELLREVCAFALACGARVVPSGMDAHDTAVAAISHLPHVFAEVLAALGERTGPLALRLAAGSFGDATRVAGTRPELVRAMCEGNSEALFPLLDTAIERLRTAREALGQLTETGHAARGALARIRTAPTTEVLIDLTANEARAGLRTIGESGGEITGSDGHMLTAEVPL
ncbi:prephenate dehydrogenase [Sciscionella marina]|uniref:prephenate dehydrogenase n=1 Tax=Sciscionella marina TaxID=508770 RepID=UPI0003818C0B|nr:prephenate dehydrogenase [Sciscionella marina]